MSSAPLHALDLQCWCLFERNCGIGLVAHCCSQSCGRHNICAAGAVSAPDSDLSPCQRTTSSLPVSVWGDLRVSKDREEAKACSTLWDLRHFLILWLA